MNDLQSSRTRQRHVHRNIAILRGVLSSDPRTRELPSGSVVINYELSCLGSSGEKHSVPVSWIDPSRPPALGEGDEVAVVGSIRRRFFRSAGSTQRRTGVVAKVVSRPTSSRVAKAIDAAMTELRD